jgi:hypothetical protein
MRLPPLLAALVLVCTPLAAPLAAPPCEKLFPERDCEQLTAQIAKLIETGISSSDAKSLANRCLDGALTARQTSRVLMLLVRARIAGLPKEALLNKLNEGLGKRVEPDELMKAVESRALNLRLSLDLVREATTGNIGEGAPDLVILVADLLGMGKDRREVAQVLEMLYTRDRKIDLIKVKEALLR